MYFWSKYRRTEPPIVRHTRTEHCLTTFPNLFRPIVGQDLLSCFSGIPKRTTTTTKRWRSKNSSRGRAKNFNSRQTTANRWVLIGFERKSLRTTRNRHDRLMQIYWFLFPFLPCPGRPVVNGLNKYYVSILQTQCIGIGLNVEHNVVLDSRPDTIHTNKGGLG